MWTIFNNFPRVVYLRPRVVYLRPRFLCIYVHAFVYLRPRINLIMKKNKKI